MFRRDMTVVVLSRDSEDVVRELDCRQTLVAAYFRPLAGLHCANKVLELRFQGLFFADDHLLDANQVVKDELHQIADATDVHILDVEVRFLSLGVLV